MRLKKWMGIVLLVLCLSFVSVGAISEEILDLSQYSDEQILAISKQVQTEMVNRKLEGTATLEAGMYEGGKDVPAGRYILICKTDSEHHGIVWLSSAEDDLKNEYPSKLYEYVGTDDEKNFSIGIEEGGILNVPFPAQLQIYPGVVFE